MATGERRHRQRLVGWWLGVEYSKLTGAVKEVDDHFEDMLETFKDVIDDPESARELVARGADEYEVKKQLSRVRRALGGTSVGEIAAQEHVTPQAVSASLRYALARLAVLTREETETIKKPA